MIEFKTGNILKNDAEALVNTVNCVGIMGKGIALQFKQAFPENYESYLKVCKQKKLLPGKVFVFKRGSFVNPKYIINFPTKGHWKEKSKIEYIEEGLKSLVSEIVRLGIKSVAIPPLGCGMGGLSWEVVKSKMESSLRVLKEVRICMYEPLGSPKPETMPIRTKEPKLTKARALFISLINRYAMPGYKVTTLEIQKLAYFLQELGEPLRLRYQKDQYGPYADNLHHVLQVLEGHYIRGYGDRKVSAKIHLINEAASKAKNLLRNENESLQRLQNVFRVIDGFETPYGLEILSTVHWLVCHEGVSHLNVDEIIEKTHQWSSRKKRIFAPDHIRKAHQHLLEISVLTT